MSDTDSDIQMTNISLQYLRSAGVVCGGGCITVVINTINTWHQATAAQVC